MEKDVNRAQGLGAGEPLMLFVAGELLTTEGLFAADELFTAGGLLAAEERRRCRMSVANNISPFSFPFFFFIFGEEVSSFPSTFCERSSRSVRISISLS